MLKKTAERNFPIFVKNRKKSIFSYGAAGTEDLPRLFNKVFHTLLKTYAYIFVLNFYTASR